MTKKPYAKPQLVTHRSCVFDEPKEEASPEDMAAVERLRPLYLLSERTDLMPIATRLAIRGDRRRGEWQKVLHEPGARQKSELQEAEGELYFLCYVPHSSYFKIELQTLCPDAKTRIAVANEVSVPSDKKVGFFLLSKKQGVAFFASSAD